MNGTRQGDVEAPDESTIRKELTDAVLTAGVMAFCDWKDRRRGDPALSRIDMVSDIYVAMRRATGRLDQKKA